MRDTVRVVKIGGRRKENNILCDHCHRKVRIVCWWKHAEPDATNSNDPETPADLNETKGFVGQSVDLNVLCFGKENPAKPWQGFIGYEPHQVESKQKKACEMSGKTPTDSQTIADLVKEILRERRLEEKEIASYENYEAFKKTREAFLKKLELESGPGQKMEVIAIKEDEEEIPLGGNFITLAEREYRKLIKRIDAVLASMPPLKMGRSKQA
jgi:hypothetical protein